MYAPNDDLNRQASRSQYDGVSPAGSTGSTRGSLAALLIVVILLGGFVTLASLSGAPVDEDGNVVEGEAATGSASSTTAAD